MIERSQLDRAVEIEPIMAAVVIRKKFFIRVVGFLVVASSVSLFAWTLMHASVRKSNETPLGSIAQPGSRKDDHNTANKPAVITALEDLHTKRKPLQSRSVRDTQTVRQTDVKPSKSSIVQTARSSSLTDGNTRRRLIIVGQARTGSSFLGDAFNQHPDVFYLFEPLYGVAPPKLASDSKPMQFLEGILRCKFDFPLYVREIEKFRRFSSQALSSPPLCVAKNSKKLQKSDCVRLTPNNMESTCVKYSATVFKILTARIPNYRLDSLFPLCNSSDCGMIYLVRDPRSLIFSHMKVGFAWNTEHTRETNDSLPQPIIKQYSQKICQQIEENVRIFQSLPSWTKRGYYMLRYEDLARNPVEILRRVYKMAGLEMLQSSLEWIKDHTGEGTGGTDSRAGQKYNHYSTNRNSKVVVDRWRIEVDPCIVNIVEESCRSVMKLLGYKPVNRSDKTQY